MIRRCVGVWVVVIMLFLILFEIFCLNWGCGVRILCLLVVLDVLVGFFIIWKFMVFI